MTISLIRAANQFQFMTRGLATFEAQVARDVVLEARDDTLEAQEAAEIAQSDSETARDQSQVARVGSEAARDIAAGYASDALTGGMDPGVTTAAGIPGLSFPDGVTQFDVAGFYNNNDRAPHKRVLVSTPVPGAQYSADGKLWAVAKDFAVNIFAFGAKASGDPADDDTLALEAAIATGERRIMMPDPVNSNGKYTFGSKPIVITRGLEIFGQHRERTRIVGNFLFGSQGMFSFQGAGPNVEDNIQGVIVRDMTLSGQGDAMGYSAFTHLIGVGGVTGATFERVNFIAPRGDAIYLGGKKLSGGSEARRNKTVIIDNCLFDGLVKNCRNAVSIIDCDGYVIKHNTFTRIGNSTLSRSVGPIDHEPNDEFSKWRNGLIEHNDFYDNDSVNTAAITVFNGLQNGNNMGDLVITKNRSDRSYVFFKASAKAKTPADQPDVITIHDNHIENSVTQDIIGGGLKGVDVSRNTFVQTPKKAMSNGGGIHVGTVGSINGIDWTITDNHFIGLRPQFGCIAVYGARGLKTRGNTYQDIQGRSFMMVAKATAGTRRYLENMDVAESILTAQDDDFTAAASLNLGLISEGSPVGPEFINHTNTLSRNKVDPRVALVRGGSAGVWIGQPVPALPTVGSFRVGNILEVNGVRQRCTTSGTIASVQLSGVTGSVTNGSRLVSGVVDPTSDLREGQFIKLGDSATVHEIGKISADGTTLYLVANFTGTTAANAAITFTPFSFAAA